VHPLDAEHLDRLRVALSAADYTVDGVAAALGPLGHAALARNETTPGLRATTGGSPLETLTRLWPLQADVTVEHATRALPGLMDALVAARVLERDGDVVRATVDLRPYADDDVDWWVFSDLTPGLDAGPNVMAADHVLGVSPASTSLAQLTVRRPVGSALDLGTGCGVQSLHLSTHADRVVATDLNPRAVALTRATAALNGLDLDVREGSFFEPVARETFDLVVSNPPFVVSPGTGDLLTYRDSGLPGDEVVRRVVTGAAALLAPDGVAQVLGNWVHEAGRRWEERVASWVGETGCDAWVVEREVADVAQYAELWLRDAGLDRRPDYTQRYDAWVRWFDEQGVEAVGFGWLVLRRAERDRPQVRIEQWPHEVEQPLGPEVGAWLRGSDLDAALTDEQVIAVPWKVRADVVQESIGAPGAPDPERIVLRQQRGMRRARQVDTVQAAMVGACDGDLAPGQILGAVTSLLDLPPLPPGEQAGLVRELVADGYLVP
jgi:methylase of polypeptide subunit release factors